MKFLPPALLSLLCVVGTSTTSANRQQDEESAIFNPHRISFADLKSAGGSDSDGGAFLDALTDVGLVAIKDIPNYGILKDGALAAIHGCTSTSHKVETQKYADGTVRQTLATHTVPGPGGARAIFGPNEKVAEGCADLVDANGPLRDLIGKVIQTFADRLGATYSSSTSDEEPILATEGGVHKFHTISDIVKNGEHLEHFHSYQRAGVDAATGARKTSNTIRGRETIDYHVDQGIFLAFVPGMISSTEDQNIRPIDSVSSGGFYIKQKDGSQVKVNFDSDDLIFMIGDGVNQYINPHISNSSKDGDAPRLLRAAPHALIMPDHQGNEARVWHGRMVLPPPGAVHPTHGKTFDELRRLMIESVNSKDHQDEHLNVGCSSPTASARLLSDGDHDDDAGHTCEGNTTYCWFRCMDLEEAGVSEEICAAEGKKLQCTNPRDLISDGTQHGDYYPGCTNSEEPDVPYPRLPVENGYPRDEDSCAQEDFDAFASGIGTDVAFARDVDGATAVAKSYDHEFDFGKAKFLWSVTEDGMVDGRLAFNGLFGFLAWGIAGPSGSKKNGMHEASIIMALPGGNYSAVTGLDLSMKPTVEEYQIHPTSSPFRTWMTPIEGRDTSTYSVDSNSCFTAISFKTDTINGIPFNLEGKDELLWGANSEDYYVGYHGHDQRARFSIDWSTGEAALFTVPLSTDEETNDDHDHDHDHDHDDGVHSQSDTSAGIRVEATVWMAATAAGGLLVASVSFI